MNLNPLPWACLLAVLVAASAGANPAGHYSTSQRVWSFSTFDFKNGVGIADPDDEDNPCTTLRLGARPTDNLVGFPGRTWDTLRIATNLQGPAVGVGNLSPPLTPVPAASWLAGSAGIPLAPCPIPGSPGNIWLVWSGMNWRSFEDTLSTEMTLCSGQSQTNGCYPIVGAHRLHASACPWDAASFTADYADNKGLFFGGLPNDLLHLGSDAIQCAGTTHTHDYASTVNLFDQNYAAQRLDGIRNWEVVHPGAGDSYLAVCWEIDYLDLDDLAAGTQTARTHDWLLVLDVEDSALNHTAAILNHLGPLSTPGLPPPAGAGVGTFALQGLYSTSPTEDGQNGSGPCGAGDPPEASKPVPLV